MKDFLETLPPLIATYSKSLLAAPYRLVQWLATRLWAIYYRVETQILGVIVDLSLTVVALRYLFLLLGIGVLLAYFGQWKILIGYVLVLGIAILRFFKIDSKTVNEEKQHHKQSRESYVRLLRWPLRVLASIDRKST